MIEDVAWDKDEKVISQLYQYARVLSFRTKIPLDQIRCAWFDEELYFEFSPSKAKVTSIKNEVSKNK